MKTKKLTGTKKVVCIKILGGGSRTRTDHRMLAKHVLYQMSYAPKDDYIIFVVMQKCNEKFTFHIKNFTDQVVLTKHQHILVQ